MSTKRLYRSEEKKVIAGVAGGIADYFEIDVILVRIIWLVALFTQIGLPAYIIAWIIIPEATSGMVTPENTSTNKVNPQKATWLLGLFLVGLGAYFLIDQFLPFDISRFIWPLALVGLGVALLTSNKWRSKS